MFGQVYFQVTSIVHMYGVPFYHTLKHFELSLMDEKTVHLILKMSLTKIKVFEKLFILSPWCSNHLTKKILFGASFVEIKEMFQALGSSWLKW